MSESELPEEKIEQEEVQDSQMSQETGEVKQTEEAQKSQENSEAGKVEESHEKLSAEEIQDKAEEKAAAEQETAKPVIQVPLAPRCENPIIGRKVFFVNPPLYVENYLQPELMQHEYEAYIIKDYKYTKNALRLFPDALCFIFIDDEMSYDGWFNYILSFQQDEKLKTIFVGLMSAMIPQQKRERFMMNLSLPGGFIMLNEVKGSALIENVIGILELNGAKGKRKYIRLDCDENIIINGYFANQTQLLQVSIANLSSVGFTCYFPKSYGSVLVKNMIVPSFSITLGRRSIATPSVVFDVKALNNNTYFAVLLFLKQVGAEDRKVIKSFIFEYMEKRVDNLIYADPPDIDDYLGKASDEAEAENEKASEGEKKEELKTDSKSESKSDDAKKEESVDEVEEIEEAEEVEETEKTEKTEEAEKAEKVEETEVEKKTDEEVEE